jgi:hypothetical protein
MSVILSSTEPKIKHKKTLSFSEIIDHKMKRQSISNTSLPMVRSVSRSMAEDFRTGVQIFPKVLPATTKHSKNTRFISSDFEGLRKINFS